MTLKRYVLASAASALAITCYATYLFNDLFPVLTFLTRNLVARLILGNFICATVIALCHVLQLWVLGTLTPDEIRDIQTHLKVTLIECFIVMGAMLKTFDSIALAQMGGILILRVVHYIIDSRVDGILQDLTAQGRRRARKLLYFTLAILALDAYCAIELYYLLSPNFELYNLIKPSEPFLKELKKPQGFLFTEVAHLLINCVQSLLKYCVYTYEIYTDFAFPTKPVWMFFIEATHEVLRIGLYILFTRTRQWLFFHIRELMHDAMSLKDRVIQFANYIRISRNLQTKFPDATPEQLNASEGAKVCIICREDMDAAKRLPCGHMFHLQCLHSWFARDLKCPTCLASVESVLLSTGATSTGAAEHADANPNANANADANADPNANVNANVDANENAGQQTQAPQAGGETPRAQSQQLLQQDRPIDATANVPATEILRRTLATTSAERNELGSEAPPTTVPSTAPQPTSPTSPHSAASSSSSTTTTTASYPAVVPSPPGQPATTSSASPAAESQTGSLSKTLPDPESTSLQRIQNLLSLSNVPTQDLPSAPFVTPIKRRQVTEAASPNVTRSPLANYVENYLSNLTEHARTAAAAAAAAVTSSPALSRGTVSTPESPAEQKSGIPQLTPASPMSLASQTQFLTTQLGLLHRQAQSLQESALTTVSQIQRSFGYLVEVEQQLAEIQKAIDSTQQMYEASIAHQFALRAAAGPTSPALRPLASSHRTNANVSNDNHAKSPE